MSEQTIKPERITKPIQLLGAWLTGLFSIDSCFLVAAANMPSGPWEARALIIAVIANVPLFLAAVFLLQTKFRPELQEDSYYSSYLSRKTNEVISINKDDAQFAELRQKFTQLENLISAPTQVSGASESKLASVGFGINKHFSNRQQIGEKLLERGIMAYSTFGSDEPPPDRTAAISQYLPRDVVKEVITLARDLQFDGYTMFDPRGEGTDEDVLLGAYGGLEFQIAKQEPSGKS